MASGSRSSERTGDRFSVGDAADPGLQFDPALHCQAVFSTTHVCLQSSTHPDLFIDSKQKKGRNICQVFLTGFLRRSDVIVERKQEAASAGDE